MDVQLEEQYNQKQHVLDYEPLCKGAFLQWAQENSDFDSWCSSDINEYFDERHCNAQAFLEFVTDCSKMHHKQATTLKHVFPIVFP